MTGEQEFNQMELSFTREQVQAQFGFDLSQFHSHLDAEDDLQVVVRGHLYAEHCLIEIIKLIFRKSELINLARIGFPLKVELCCGFGVLDENTARALKRLNKLRNSIAHDLHYRSSEADKREIFDMMRPDARSLVLEKGERGKTYDLSEVSLGQVLKVLCIFVELYRQSFADWALKRAAAFENAKRVLAKTSPA